MNNCEWLLGQNMKRLAIVAVLAILSMVACDRATKPGQSKMTIPEYRDKWKLVEVRPKESKEIWMFRKNLGASDIKGLKQLPYLVYFTVQYVPIDESGLPNAEDTKVLYDFEEQVIPEIEKQALCVHVASVVKGGVKDHLFYVSDPDLFIKTLNEHRKALESYRVSLEKHDDPQWKIYADFPGE
jgi:hypothetical protein